jgi:hypothetical protein
MKILHVFLFLLVISISKAQNNLPSGKISGIIFGDYFYNLNRDTGILNLKNTALTGKENIHGLSIKRIYFTYDYIVSPKLSSRLRLESDDNTFNVNTKNETNKFGVFIKDAYLKWGIFRNNYIIIGIQHTPAYELSEIIWGNRFIEKTLMDLRGIVPSRDMAISLKGQIDSSGLIKYNIMYGNNSYTKPETDKYKRLYFNIEINPYKYIYIIPGIDYQFKEKITNSYLNVKDNNDIFTTSLFTGYKNPNRYTLGVESYFQNTNNGFDDSTSLNNKKSIGIAIFGYYYISKKLYILCRYDYFDPNISRKSGADIRNYYIGSINYKVADNFIIAPNILIETYEKTSTRQIKNSVTCKISFNWIF